MRVLVVNAGSSTVKLSLVGNEDETIAARELPAPHSQADTTELYQALNGGLAEADAIGHRIVHGGVRFRDAVLIGNEVERELRDLTDLAPLHQPKSLAALDAVTTALPDIPSVACFDTAFHATMPARPLHMRFQQPGASAGAYGAMASMVSLMHGWRGACRKS